MCFDDFWRWYWKNLFLCFNRLLFKLFLYFFVLYFIAFVLVSWIFSCCILLKDFFPVDLLLGLFCIIFFLFYSSLLKILIFLFSWIISTFFMILFFFLCLKIEKVSFIHDWRKLFLEFNKFFPFLYQSYRHLEWPGYFWNYFKIYLQGSSWMCYIINISD